MYKDIFISINPKYIEKIVTKEKRYELRNFNTKFPIERFFIYVTSPVKKLSYIAEVEKPINYPSQIKNQCCEAFNFNNGYSKYKKAYAIKNLYKLKSPIPLATLKENYYFSAPQSYSYSDKYPKLIEDLMKQELIKMF